MAEKKFFSSEIIRSDGSKSYTNGQADPDDPKNHVAKEERGHVTVDKTGCITFVRNEAQEKIYDSKKDSSYVPPK